MTKTKLTRRSVSTTPPSQKTREPSPAKSKGETWGRAHGKDRLSLFLTGLIFFTCPFIVFAFLVSCDQYDCQLVQPAMDIFSGKLSVVEIARNSRVAPTAWHFGVVIGWILYQAALYCWLPGPKGYGQLTPAGHILEYNINGWRVLFLNLIMYCGASFYLELFSPTIIYDNFLNFIAVACVLGYVLSFLVYIKAFVAPTHPEDNKVSGNIIYDFFMGVEFNPRIGILDFKLFFNGRPGISLWPLINISFAAAQYANFGTVTNSMILVNILQFLYVADFFWNEDWYLRTIDICHDHFGFYLQWGDLTWLPGLYTLQGLFLVTHPVVLTNLQVALVVGCGATGYFIFRSVNHQKDSFRKDPENCIIWGKKATYLKCPYVTTDGKKHVSTLLTSGFWGLSRHFNYLGDLLLSFAYCAACGFEYLLPYFYIIYMIILLVQRVFRDEARLRAKYGENWDEYCRIVPYRIIPYIF